ncbi:transposase [Desulfitibacter alkalitolerans]|uniref:transposase n=1 Tax=Desulfitibacter alkalitolerans TaxID=264641 RepID=UPI0030F37574
MILKNVKLIDPYKLLGYCLMSNHVHLLMQEGENNIGRVMKRIGVAYVQWYNRKHGRVGHLFQDRYKSEEVEDDTYLLTVLRYIHQNPVKAKIVNSINDYKWSSFKNYLGEKSYPLDLVDTELIFDLLDIRDEVSIERFNAYMSEPNTDKCLDDEEQKDLPDKEVEMIIEAMLNIVPATSIKNMDQKKRNEALRKIKSMDGITIRQISRITGIGRYIINKA